jgi:hypothetical protein
MNTEHELKRSGHWRRTLKLLSLQQLSVFVFTRSSAVFLVKVAVDSLRVCQQCEESEFIIRFCSLKQCKTVLLRYVPVLLAEFVKLLQGNVSGSAVAYVE